MCLIALALPVARPVLALTFALALDALAGPNCNTRSGQVSDQPPPPILLTTEDVLSLPTEAAPDISTGAREIQSINIDLASQLDSLAGFSGRYTSGVSILGLRLENYPAFDPRKDCNRVAVYLVKPRIDRLPTGEIRASYENGRFATNLSRSRQLAAMEVDADESRRFVWIFPAYFGKFRGKNGEPGRPLKMTAAYDEAFRKAPKGSDRRRWIAEAYLNLMLRHYRQESLSRTFPKTHHFHRSTVAELFKEKGSLDCQSDPSQVPCLISDLIERNETGGSEKPRFGDDAFRSGDALLMDSGISTGIRQLDFGTVNEQATELAPKLLPAIFQKEKRGEGLRRPIRQWDVQTLTRWYTVDGLAANERLSERDAQQMLVESHVQYVLKAANASILAVSARYPSFPPEEKVFLAMVRTDLENVSGYSLQLPARALSYCDVLTDGKVEKSRSNNGLVRQHLTRVRNARDLLYQRFSEFRLNGCGDLIENS